MAEKVDSLGGDSSPNVALPSEEGNSLNALQYMGKTITADGAPLRRSECVHRLTFDSDSFGTSTTFTDTVTRIGPAS